MAPAKRSPGLLWPTTTGRAMMSRAKRAYTSTMRCFSASASAAVAWAVWPSCQRNSAVRRNSRVRISQRTTLHHWLHRMGRSRQEWIQFLYVFQMMVSEVGRTMSSSSSFASGSTTTPLPPGSFIRRWCVTTAHSFANPATCSASRLKKDLGMKSAGFLEHAVENMLHLLPDGVSVGLDDHAAADGGLLGQVGLHHEVVVPLGVVLGPFRYLFCHNSIAFSIAFLKNCQ